jgi:hypothetical protein
MLRCIGHSFEMGEVTNTFHMKIEMLCVLLGDGEVE